MTASSLRVSRRAPHPSPTAYGDVGDMPWGGYTSTTINAAYYNGKTYIGYEDGNGAIHVLSYNHSTGAIVISPSIVTGLAVDTHCGPSVLVRQSDHKIVLAVTGHGVNHMYIAVSTNAEDVSSWGAANDIASTLAGGAAYTYANLVQLSGESGKIYLFYRDNGPTDAVYCYSTSTDGGATWAAQTQLYAPAQGNNAPYAWLTTDSATRIDFAVNDGNVEDSKPGSLYHFYYSGGSFFTSTGTTISVAKPYASSNLTKILDGPTSGGTLTTMHIVNSGPTIVFDAAPAAGLGTGPLNIRYAAYSGGAWSVHTITDNGTGSGSPAINSGGSCINPNNTSQVFLGKSVSGVYQAFLYQTSDGGTTWTNTQLTSDVSSGNFGFNTPRDAASGLLSFWGYGLPYGNKLRVYPNKLSAF